MAPTEETILNHFLIAPSHLPAILSLEQFKELFPRSLQSSPGIRTLYRDLQSQRNAVLDVVRANIDAEVKRSNALRRAVAKGRREAEKQEDDLEVEIEEALHELHPENAGNRVDTSSLASLLPELGKAATELEAEIQYLEEEKSETLQEVKQVVGGLSDLRYGRFSNGKLRDQLVESLDELQQTCEKAVN